MNPTINQEIRLNQYSIEDLKEKLPKLSSTETYKMVLRERLVKLLNLINSKEFRIDEIEINVSVKLRELYNSEKDD